MDFRDEAGIRIHDGAIGGLSGCPFAPGAKGNTSTEDLVFMFEEMGISTGVKMDALKNSMEWAGCSGPKRNR